MNIATWNRKLEQQRLDKFLRSSKKADKKLDPNCQHSFPDGMALAYLIPPFPLTMKKSLRR